MVKKFESTWCPEIQDYCKGDICVCYGVKSKVESLCTDPGQWSLHPRPFCHNYQVYLPEDAEDERV